jgi:hypothetical protein
MEASRSRLGRKREGRLSEEPPLTSAFDAPRARQGQVIGLILDSVIGMVVVCNRVPS